MGIEEEEGSNRTGFSTKNLAMETAQRNGGLAA